MNSGKIVADGTGRDGTETSKVLQEVLADLKNAINSSTLRTKDFRPSSASKKLVAAFLWSAKGEMS